MNKEWVDKKNREYEDKIKKQIEFVKKEIQNTHYHIDNKDELLLTIDKKLDYRFVCKFDIPYFFLDDDDYGDKFLVKEKIRECKKWINSLNIRDIYNYYENPTPYDRYLDSEPKEFDGDIIITDPGYICKGKDWNKCECGDNMDAIGIHSCITRDTIYGDWSCTTYNSDTKEPIGEFCADAGMVGVFLASEIFKYNPNYKYNEWSATYIKDFKGVVQFIVVRTEGIYDETTEYHTKGDKWVDYSVDVVGHGINKTTGKLLNFVGKQSGF